ncbi:MAG TPA: hypothetical protein VIO14_10780 [Dehalococcoidia bacterium]
MRRTASGPGGPFTCANCEITFGWPPTVRAERAYCCPGCAQGGPCTCDYAAPGPAAAPAAARVQAGRKEGS